MNIFQKEQYNMYGFTFTENVLEITVFKQQDIFIQQFFVIYSEFYREQTARQFLSFDSQRI